MDDSGSEEGDELSSLEKALALEVETENQAENQDSDDAFKILGSSKNNSWSPQEKIMDYYLKIADMELNKDVISELQEEFKCPDDIQSHFNPPKFPSSFWELVQKSPNDLFKLKSLFKVQENLFLAIKPLLSCLESVPKENRDDITKAIQLITYSNLNLNRFRRVTIAPYLRADIRKQILALPVKHN